MPGRIKHTKKPFIEFETGNLKIFWHETVKKTKENLLEALSIGISEGLFTIKEKVLGGVTLFEKGAGIRRLVDNADFAFGGGN